MAVYFFVSWMQNGRELLWGDKRDKQMKLYRQVMEKLDDMEEYDQIEGKEFESWIFFIVEFNAVASQKFI